MPKVHAKEAAKTFKAITKAISEGSIKACHDLSEGGLAVAASEMALASSLGAKIDLAKVPSEGVERDDFLLFSESNSRFLVEVAEKDQPAFEAALKGRAYAQVGKVTQKPKFTAKGIKGPTIIDAGVSDLRAAWKRTLSGGPK